MPRGVFEENFETFPPRLFLCSLNRVARIQFVTLGFLKPVVLDQRSFSNISSHVENLRCLR